MKETDWPEPEVFWTKVGIDPIRITTDDGDLYTLRCYVRDRPVFLGASGRIDVFATERELAGWLAGPGRDGHDLAGLSTWWRVVQAADAGELEIEVGEHNAYTLVGLADDIAGRRLVMEAEDRLRTPGGPYAGWPSSWAGADLLRLAAEVLIDAGDWAGDPRPRESFAESHPLGQLYKFVVKPERGRDVPPLDQAAARFRELVQDLHARFRFRV